MVIDQANLAGIYASFSTIFNQAFAAAATQWPLVAMEVPSTGRSVDYKWLGAWPMMREWLGDRVIKDLSAFHYELINKKYEATIEVDRTDIADDQIGVYTPIIQGLGQAAANHPDILVWELLAAGFSTICYDGQYYFDSDHPVGESTASNTGGGSGNPWFLLDLSRPIKPIILQIRERPQFVSQDRPEDEHAFMRDKYRYGTSDRKNVGFGLWQIAYGSKDTLNATNYATARAAMMALTADDEETKLGIVPTHLVHGPANESAAKTLIDAQFDAAGASNIWAGSVTRVMVPWLA